MKLALGILYDLFDLTVGRALFAAPSSSEIVGVALGCALFGPRAPLYALEALDPAEPVDGLVPTPTLIALAARRDERRA